MFKAIKNFFKEIKDELAEEAAEKAKADEEKLATILALPNSLERQAIALACPLRSFFIMTEWPPLYLHQLGVLSDRQKVDLAKYLERDFDVTDEDSFHLALGKWVLGGLAWSLDDLEAFQDVQTFHASVGLYLLTTSVDLGYVTFEDYQVLAAFLVQAIANRHQTWEEFAQAIEAEDFINHGLGKKILTKESQSLLAADNETSPWRLLAWSDLTH